MQNSSVLTLEASTAIQRVNARYWPNARQARRRARRELCSAELALIGSCREQLSGNVLEIGSRGDRLTGTLAGQASSLTGVGASTPTLELCRTRYPTARFVEENLTDLRAFDDGQFSAVVAGRYALDLLPEGPRRRLFGALNRILTADGRLIFSSHNLAYESLIRTPLSHAIRNPTRLWKLPRGLSNRAHIGRLQQREHGFGMFNDATHAYGLLQYYVSRAHQERQLFEHDFRLLECLTAQGDPVACRESAYRSRELYYLAQPLARG